jgi:predicted nucleic acid-binding protein
VILVDTSAWVEFDRATESPTHVRLRDLIIEGGPVAVTEPIVMEVVIGARDARREADLRRLMASFALLPFDATTDFEAASRIYLQCRRAGITPRGTIDCMVVAVAQRTGSAILAADRDLDQVCGVIGVERDR